MRAILGTLVLFSMGLPATAQWTSLATNNDGSQIYFVSNLQQTGSGQPLWGKLFVADQSGVRAILIRNRDIVGTALPPLGANFYLTNAYNVIGVDVAADVSRLAVVATGICTVASGICDNTDVPTATTVYDTTGTGTNFPGRGRLSPDGIWLSVFLNTLISPFPLSVWNLSTNATKTSSFPSGSGDYKSGSIANNGEFAFGGLSAGLTVTPFGGTPTTLQNQSASARFDAAGDALIWNQTANGRGVIMAAKAPAITSYVLFSAEKDANDPSISSDGSRALFLTADTTGMIQAFLINLDGSGLSQVTKEPLGITEAILTPDGQTVVAVGGDGSLLRVRLATGERDQIIGPTCSLTPQIQDSGALTSPTVTVTPGQVVHLTGTQLSGAAVQVGGLQAPITGRTAASIDFQVPWETPVVAVSLVTNGVPYTVTPGSSSSGWQGGGQGILSVNAVNAAWVLAAHENFQGLITPSSPGKPGEIINLYATGFGPVANPPDDGQPAPNFPLSPLLTPLSLTLVASSAQTYTPQVIFAGLAPGTVGYYQISIQLPAMLTSDTFTLETSLSGPTRDIRIPVSQ